MLIIFLLCCREVIASGKISHNEKLGMFTVVTVSRQCNVTHHTLFMKTISGNQLTINNNFMPPQLAFSRLQEVAKFLQIQTFAHVHYCSYIYLTINTNA